MAIDKVGIASKNWAEDYLTENGRRFNNMLRDAFITGFKKGVQLSRRTGKWIESDMDIDFVTCSYCKEHKLDGRMAWRPDYADTMNYCPNCGARMGADND